VNAFTGGGVSPTLDQVKVEVFWLNTCECEPRATARDAAEVVEIKALPRTIAGEGQRILEGSLPAPADQTACSACLAWCAAAGKCLKNGSRPMIFRR